MFSKEFIDQEIASRLPSSTGGVLKKAETSFLLIDTN